MSLSLARERIRHDRGRLLLNILLQAVVLFVLGRLIPGVLVENAVAAVIASMVLAILNALVRPILVILTLPLSVASFGVASLLINTAMVVLAAPIVPGMEVNGFLPAFALAVVLTVATTAIQVVLTVDDDAIFYAELARRIGAADVPHVEPGQAGLVIIQIDGLAAPILANAIRVGMVPKMAHWVRSGGHRLIEWECPAPSQTSASQAGILLGDNTGIPAFRWYEKDSGRLLVSNRPADAAEIERRLTTGDGLLASDGTSIGNLFSGQATRNAFVVSRMRDPLSDLDVDAFSLYFVDPAAFVRTVMLSVSEFVKELIEARRQRRQDIQPRVHRGTTFAFLRAATNVVLRDLNTTFVVRSMALGVPVIYVDFVDYDEVAHHAGPERLESLRSLTGVDQVVASLERAARDAPRDYRFVLLSDHGQSQGATFRQRYGQSLEALLQALMGGAASVVAATGRSETYGPVTALLGELAKRPGAAGRLGKRTLQSAEASDRVDPAVSAAGAGTPDAAGARPELVVCASGNLANVYFNASPARMSAEAIEARYPGLLASLADHPGIGFLMVRADTGGTLVLGRTGLMHLDDGRVTGDDPLASFGPRAADHLRRLDGFDHVGDLLVNSTYDADLDEVAAFEELVGSHGGMGGPQNRPFLLAPTELMAVDHEPLVGAPSIHRLLRGFTDSLGIRATPDASGPTSAVPVRRARGLSVVAGYIGLQGTVLGIVGLIALWLATMGGGAGSATDGLRATLGPRPAITGVVLVGLGSMVLLTAWGVWRRRRRAWMAALAISGLSAIQILFALASGGLPDVIGIGIINAVISLVLFYYLTRPFVAHEFGRRPSRRRKVPSADAA